MAKIEAFNNTHLNKIRDLTMFNLRLILKDRVKNLEKKYKENPYIENARVKLEGEDGNISITLNFETEDTEKQDLVSVFEYGGIIKKKGGEMVKVEPGFYIKRYLMKGK